ncbi:MAG TPA: TIGR03435 family protein [Verrucomicrobiae bacterium]|nr:TIGR03435 family protein [Verrucomicrobiae bacterium]
MLRTLLAERFHLVVQTSKISSAGYTLTQLKGGIEIKPVEPDSRSSSNTSRGKLTAERITIGDLTRHLTGLLGDPVVDETGLPKVYSFTLEWSPEDPNGFEDVLAEKLGLKIENKRITLDTIVVDRAEKPNGN